MTLLSASTIATSRRTLVPKVNDLATTDPVLVLEWHSYLNWKEPSKTFAGTDPVWWRCLAERHVYQQSAPNRRKAVRCARRNNGYSSSEAKRMVGATKRTTPAGDSGGRLETAPCGRRNRGNYRAFLGSSTREPFGKLPFRNPNKKPLWVALSTRASRV